MGMQPDVPSSVDEEDFGGRGGAFALLGFGVKRKVEEPDCLPEEDDSTLAAELAGDDDAEGAEGADAEADLAFEDEGVEDELAALLAQGEEPEEEDVEVDVDGDLDALEAPAAKRARAQPADGDEAEDDLVDFPAEGDAAPATPPAAKSKAKAAAKAAAAPEPEDDDEEVEIEIDEADAADADELAQTAAGDVKSKGKGKGKGKLKPASEDTAAEVAVEDDWDLDDKPAAGKAGKAAGKAGKAAGKAGKAGRSGLTEDEEGFKDVFDDDDDDTWKALSKGKGKDKGMFKKGGGKDFWGNGGFKGGFKDGAKGGFKGGCKGGGKDAGPEPKSVQEWVAAQSRLFGNLGPLPAGWIRIRSSSTQKVYFYSTKTGESRDGDNPPAPSMPANWQVMTSKSSGQTYYYNSKTGASQFDMPLA